MTGGWFLLVCDDAPYDVMVTDPRVLDVVQVVRRLTGLSLWHSKMLVTQVPALILNEVPEEDATRAILALRDAGARAEAREQP